MHILRDEQLPGFSSCFCAMATYIIISSALTLHSSKVLDKCLYGSFVCNSGFRQHTVIPSELAIL